MILSRQHHFAFIKTIKTASTSVEIALSRFAGPQDILTYLPPPDEALRAELGAPGPQNCFNPMWKQILLRLSGTRRHADVLDPQTRARIESVAGREIETFGYQWRKATTQ